VKGNIKNMKNHYIDKRYEYIKKQKFEGERPLFKSSFLHLDDCEFISGESAVKIADNINAKNCKFSSKYLFWHNKNLNIKNSFFYDGARASIWYTNKVVLENCKVDSPKIFRDAKNITIQNTAFNTNETLWDCEDIKIKDVQFKGDYLLFHSSNIDIENFTLDGNYSFQHTKNMKLKNIEIKSKDAFWNSENVTVYDSIINGEYLGWYSKNLKFVNCKIAGTQPLCYAKNLILENCEMLNTDLAFEYSTLNAQVTTSILSVKNPISGTIEAKEIKNLILDDEKVDLKNLKIVTQISKK
jgi:hypothetical protein